MAKEDKKQEDWMQKKWRPMMALMYMTVCVFDFILFPIMFTVVQFWETQAANDAFRQWAPLTLLGGGLFHVAMGAVLGVTAWSRGQEKIAGAASPQPMTPTSYQPTSYQPTSYQNVNYRPDSYGQDNSYIPSVVTGYNGKFGPPQAHQPLI